MTALPRRTLIVGDAQAKLAGLPSSSVDCVVTSPPYFRLRDYGAEGQLGLEPHVDAWVEQLAGVCTELGRVLTPSGVLWLNLGDSYSRKTSEGAGRKSLLMAPERLALRLIQDGWLLRSKVVWAKPNHLPSSVRDRLSCGYELVYLLVRSQGYFFDLDAIREPHRSQRQERPGRMGRSAARQRTARPDLAHFSLLIKTGWR